jgi:hypothetical protein
MDNPGPGKRMALKQRIEGYPRDGLTARASLQPFLPELRGLVAVARQLPGIPRDAVVGIMPQELRGQRGVLFGQWPVPVDPAPFLDRQHGAGEPALGRSLAHHVLAFQRLCPGMGEAEKVERRFRAVRMRATFAHRAEVDEARLVGMEHEPEPCKTLPQHFHDPLGVVVVLERHHEVVGKPNQRTRSRHAGFHLCLEPYVQHIVQEDVREYRRDGSSNAKDNLRFPAARCLCHRQGYHRLIG